MSGRIHSIQTMGAVDGPGIRAVVFVQGCPLRCTYCHNPDTWDGNGGEEASPEAVADKILRLKNFYLISDAIVLALSLSYIPLRRILWSLLTVVLSGQIIGWIQKIPARKAKEAP